MSDDPQPQLSLTDYVPRSMLRVRCTEVPRASFPVIDFHTHLTWMDSTPDNGIRLLADGNDVLPVMDRRNVRVMVNLTGGYGPALQTAIASFDSREPDRFVTFTEPCWDRIGEQDYARVQADEIERAHRAGARGLKILKVLGLFLRNGAGELVRIDDPRFDPMWETAGHLGMPVTIHVSDPDAFFLPIDRFNERWEELHAHPDWSFCGCDFPASRELHEARNRVLRRHPNTRFVCAHVANAEDLAYVSDCLLEHPNMYVDISARIGELGRQPRTARRFFETFQDRILFGTDAIPNGFDMPQQVFGDQLYQIYYRFLETEDEYFDYAPAPVPPQGRWKIYGLGLPESILEKVYWSNAARLLGLGAAGAKSAI
jgi:predicted TIM-barrel fold metal-dependent hydrolase